MLSSEIAETDQSLGQQPSGRRRLTEGVSPPTRETATGRPPWRPEQEEESVAGVRLSICELRPRAKIEFERACAPIDCASVRPLAVTEER